MATHESGLDDLSNMERLYISRLESVNWTIRTSPAVLTKHQAYESYNSDEFTKAQNICFELLRDS